MASNRKVQRLLNEFMDLLSECEIADANQDQRTPALPKSSSPVTNQIEGGSLAIDKVDNAPAKLVQKLPEHSAIDCNKDNPEVATDPTPAPANEASADAFVTDQVNQDTQPKEDGS